MGNLAFTLTRLSKCTFIPRFCLVVLFVVYIYLQDLFCSFLFVIVVFRLSSNAPSHDAAYI